MASVREIARFDAMKSALDEVRARCDHDARLAVDPVGVVHRYPDRLDREIVALIASCVAFGNVKSIRAKLDDALRRIGDRPARVAGDENELRARMAGWIHRVYIGEDIASLVVGAARVQNAYGSLGDAFANDLAAHGVLREALAEWAARIRREGGLEKASKTRRGPLHLLPDPRGASGSKRLLLFLRWMVRPADGVDLGIWPVDPAVLLCPVDTHIHKLARNLGFTKRDDLSWKTTEEITRALAQFDPKDPVKYDFSLCHLGMLQGCPSRRDATKCTGCPVMGVCRHWAAAARPIAANRAKRRK